MDLMFSDEVEILNVVQETKGLICIREIGLFRAQAPLPCRSTYGLDRKFRRGLRMQDRCVV